MTAKEDRYEMPPTGYNERMKEMFYQQERTRDFLDWLEENYLDQTIGQLWKEFEKYESKLEVGEEGNSKS
jgi:hypothetical protein